MTLRDRWLPVRCRTTIYLQCCIFIIKESLVVYARQRTENKKRGGRNGVCIARGGHSFCRAPRRGELENIILSGWFDSAMKNVRSGDDKSWCWGEGTGRRGMPFVMSAIWLHPSPPPICLFFHISPSLSPFTPQLPILPPVVYPTLRSFLFSLWWFIWSVFSHLSLSPLDLRASPQ